MKLQLLERLNKIVGVEGIVEMPFGLKSSLE